MITAQLCLFDDDQPRADEWEIPTGEEPTTCKSCGAAIVWGRTTSNTAVPLDLRHVRELAGVRYALNHFAHCPHGKDWRRR